MYKVEYDNGYHVTNLENQLYMHFCTNLFELFTPSNMHILTSGSYTGDIKAVPGRSMYVYHENCYVWLCQTKMEGIYGRAINNRSYKYYIGKKEYEYHVDDTNILLSNEFMNIEHNRVRFVLENKKCLA